MTIFNSTESKFKHLFVVNELFREKTKHISSLRKYIIENTVRDHPIIDSYELQANNGIKKIIELETQARFEPKVKKKNTFFDRLFHVYLVDKFLTKTEHQCFGFSPDDSKS